jgi:hypothetical protein
MITPEDSLPDPYESAGVSPEEAEDWRNALDLLDPDQSALGPGGPTHSGLPDHE